MCKVPFLVFCVTVQRGLRVVIVDFRHEVWVLMVELKRNKR